MKNNEYRRLTILKGGVTAAEKRGYRSVTREDVARETGLSAPLIQYYFKTITELRQAIVAQAIEDKNLKVLAQALGSLDSIALEAPARLRAQALKFIRTESSRMRANGTTPKKLRDRAQEFSCPKS